ncbi:MAG TPA: hypothetical protein VF549_08155 [Solirubrobacteraceae bacterium]
MSARANAGCWIARRAPKTVANRTAAQRVEPIAPLRRLRFTGPQIAALRRLRFTGPQIAELLEMADSTVSGILKRLGMGRLGRLGLQPPVRYERQRPGELIPARSTATAPNANRRSVVKLAGKLWRSWNSTPAVADLVEVALLVNPQLVREGLVNKRAELLIAVVTGLRAPPT